MSFWPLLHLSALVRRFRAPGLLFAALTLAACGGGGGGDGGSGDKDRETNAALTAADDSVSMIENASAQTLNVLANDDFGSDGPGSAALAIAAAPANGSAAVDDGGTPDDPADDRIIYSPDTDFTGLDSLDYRIEDADGDAAIATVSITVDPNGGSTNDSPSAEADSASMDENVGPTPIDILANDDFGSDGAASGTIAILSGPSNGTASVDNGAAVLDPTDDRIEYTPAPDFTGQDSLTYQIEDSDGDTDTATVTITVNSALSQAWGMQLFENSLATKSPSIVSAGFRVYDRRTGESVTNLVLPDDDPNTDDDITALENDQALSPAESFLEVAPLDEGVIDTALVVDISQSVGSDIQLVKEGLRSFIQNEQGESRLRDNQRVAIYTFDDAVTQAVGFTSDIAQLNSAIDGISLGGPSTNLYGAIIEAANSWTNRFEFENVRYGSMIVISDGADTASLSTAQEAQTAVANKEVFAIRVGSLDQDQQALEDIAGRGAVFNPADFNEFSAAIDDAQAELQRFIDGIYYLSYASPKRSGTHELKVTLEDEVSCNTLVGDEVDADSDGVADGCKDGYIQSFDATGFSSVQPEIVVTGETTFEQQGSLEVDTRWSNAGTYQWTVADSNAVETSTSSDGTIFTLSLPQVSDDVTTQVTVNDTANGLSQTLTINIIDVDSDDDGTPDSEDAFPNDPTEDTDSDGDGVGDNEDAFPNDSTETTDSDGDGIGDNSDPDADSPHSNDDSIVVVAGSSGNVIDVLSNDSFGVDGASTGAIEIVAQPSWGIASVDDRGTPSDPTDDRLIYEPKPGFEGEDLLEYRLTDADGDTMVASVRIDVEVRLSKFSAHETGEPKQMRLEWNVAGASAVDHYTVLVNPDGSSGYSAIDEGEAIGTTVFDHELALHFTDWVNAMYRVEARASDETVIASAELALVNELSAEGLIGYVKGSGSPQSHFGTSIAMSEDGTRMAVGTPGACSQQRDGGTFCDYGWVWVFAKGSTGWSQEAYLKASNWAGGDWFGASVAISNDGTRLAVGAYGEASSATDVNGDQTDNSADDAGAVYIFDYDGDSWGQSAYLKASNAEEGDKFGSAVTLSGDGARLAVVAPNEDSNATGINGDETDNSNYRSGAVYMFNHDGSSWIQTAYIKPSSDGVSVEGSDRVVSLSEDGSRLAVGAPRARGNGIVYVFDRNGTSWMQGISVAGSEAHLGDMFGHSVDLSGDGRNMAVGEPNDSGDGLTNSGAAYVFGHDGAGWKEEAFLKASNAGENDRFGYSVSLSGDGSSLAVGAEGEASNATGINGVESDNSASGAGALYVFKGQSTGWRPATYVKASNTDEGDAFGCSVALSGDGSSLAVGACQEDGDGQIGGDQTDDSSSDAGAVYLY